MNHRLILDENLSFDDLVNLAQNRFPNATRRGKNLNLTEEIILGGDRSKGTFIFKVPKQRAVSNLGTDLYGLKKAFGAEVPVGSEAVALQFALAAARRIGGKVITDSGVELAPSFYSVPDIQIISPYELSGKQLLEVVQELIKETRLAGEVATSSPYSLEIPLFGEAKIQIRVERLNHEIPAISHVKWVREGAVSYRINYLPEAETFANKMADLQKAEAREAYLGCSVVAKQIHQTVGGFILDSEGYLISEKDLF